MKVLLFSEGKKMFSKSGVGRALKHQMEALKHAGLEYTNGKWNALWDAQYVTIYWLAREPKQRI